MKEILKQKIKPGTLKQYYTEQARLQRWARMAKIRARLTETKDHAANL